MIKTKQLLHDGRHYWSRTCLPVKWTSVHPRSSGVHAVLFLWLLYCLLFFELWLSHKKSYCKIIWYRTTAVYWIYTFTSVRGRRGHDCVVVGFTTIYAISAYHHWCCEFESRPGRGVKHYVIKFVSDLWQVSGFLRVLRFPPQIKLTATKYCWKWR
jgi:hypothetical protein